MKRAFAVIWGLLVGIVAVVLLGDVIGNNYTLMLAILTAGVLVSVGFNWLFWRMGNDKED